MTLVVEILLHLRLTKVEVAIRLTTNFPSYTRYEDLIWKRNPEFPVEAICNNDLRRALYEAV
ncbi:predicted protein [Plenodomus lingam JN3]|uniref:Predicted protein n=1 Tax=Leptosphaeria maculans (strain JN3 / isolate v23.1.3 / race Av1-4-5-6-7-8) TaxID=985895 RepID=E4ZXE5_LEPMJ|nr:predicted protein [Plenodomus lingam JN3]CBX95355.1 predicted protein [Plenodomus lingam JN3]